MLGALSSCQAHTFLIHASDQGVPLESLHAEPQGFELVI